MTLREQQALFVSLVAKLITWAYSNGYELTWGKDSILRDQSVADANAASGAGIKNSLHLIGLAVDFNLFKNGQWLQGTADHKPLGGYWKSLHPLCRWGGDFQSRPDGNHYSLEWKGVK